ncbi:MAG: family ATPase [Solirubrobacterales bacterium]|nr:family ATPase [Solirubrobacterales bacterium]
MRLKSVTLKGFKSFPDRTHLSFGPGVSVVVGPNGSGKSNVTDAVLWAMGEQSPLAVRGQSMQDVIFGGGRGVQARSEAEVEIVLDNSDGTVALPLSEISIARRLDRTGDGGYRLNGARCRLTDVIEVLSDTGLGKETHSIISQGRVDAIVISKPRDRRMLIEEAAGLGKHRKRRRRAQLKLERTQENLDRALDVEREARTRLRPLKRQAEAAQLHERLERQTLEARWELALDVAGASRAELKDAERRVATAREGRAETERRLQETIDRRGRAERALSERAARHDAVARGVYDARSSRERLELRAEQVAGTVQMLTRRIERVELELAAAGESAATGGEDESKTGQQPSHSADRIGALEAELASIEASRAEDIARETAELVQERERQTGQLQEAERLLSAARAARERADAHTEEVRGRLAAAERRAGAARREAEQVGAELAAANQFLRSHVRVGADQGDAPAALSDELRVEDGYELALAAALGGRLDAALVEDVAGAQALLDRAGLDGGTVLLAELPAGAGAERVPDAHGQPVPGARRLLELISGPQGVLELAARLLAEAWVVERLEDLPRDFSGIAATRAGRVWFGSWGEVRQLTEGGTERVLARRNERDRLIAAAERSANAEQAARAAREQALAELDSSEEGRASAEQELREAQRRQTETIEARRRTEWLIEQRSEAPAEGPLAVRKAELEGELAAERRQSERLARERAERLARIDRLQAQREVDIAAAPLAERLAVALKSAAEAVQARMTALEAELDRDRLAGEEMATELGACATQEAEIQAALRAAGELVTDAEVAAQRLRDQAAEAELELRGLAERLGFALPQHGEDGSSAESLQEEERLALTARVERLSRRREQLGPVNPLAQQEYGEAVEHVEELESQRTDLETALRELRSVIRDTDRQIQQTFEETFAAAARNFEELVGDVFPGGTGRLRLVAEDQGTRSVLGGQSLSENGGGAAHDAAESAAQA